MEGASDNRLLKKPPSTGDDRRAKDGESSDNDDDDEDDDDEEDYSKARASGTPTSDGKDADNAKGEFLKMRREKRLAMNRASARERRKRKKVMLEYLAGQAEVLTQQNQKLEVENEALTARIKKLEADLTQAQAKISALAQIDPRRTKLLCGGGDGGEPATATHPLAASTSTTSMSQEDMIIRSLLSAALPGLNPPPQHNAAAQISTLPPVPPQAVGMETSLAAQLLLAQSLPTPLSLHQQQNHLQNLQQLQRHLNVGILGTNTPITDEGRIRNLSGDGPTQETPISSFLSRQRNRSPSSTSQPPPSRTTGESSNQVNTNNQRSASSSLLWNAIKKSKRG